jgi:hypothetical protein
LYEKKCSFFHFDGDVSGDNVEGDGDPSPLAKLFEHLVANVE